MDDQLFWKAGFDAEEVIILKEQILGVSTEVVCPLCNKVFPVIQSDERLRQAA
jgi:hypothetical protein